jgi:hypothetical protein
LRISENEKNKLKSQLNQLKISENEKNKLTNQLKETENEKENLQNQLSESKRSIENLQNQLAGSDKIKINLQNQLQDIENIKICLQNLFIQFENENKDNQDQTSSILLFPFIPLLDIKQNAHQPLQFQNDFSHFHPDYNSFHTTLSNTRNTSIQKLANETHLSSLNSTISSQPASSSIDSGSFNKHNSNSNHLLVPNFTQMLDSFASKIGHILDENLNLELINTKLAQELKQKNELIGYFQEEYFERFKLLRQSNPLRQSDPLSL